MMPMIIMIIARIRIAIILPMMPIIAAMIVLMTMRGSFKVAGNVRERAA